MNHMQLVLLAGLLAGVFSVYGRAGEVAGCLESSQPTRTEQPWWPRIEHKQPLHAACWLSWNELMQPAYQQDGVLWLDVRPSPNWQASPLNNVMQVGLHEIEDRSFLHGRSLLLVGTGTDQLMLDAACMQLRQLGFDVHALNGGIWALPGHLSGQGSDAGNVQQIGADQFLAGSQTVSWHVVTLGGSEQDIAYLPEPPRMQFGLDDVAAAQAAITTLLGQGGISAPENPYPVQVVLIAPDDESVRVLQALLHHAAADGRVVWLQGGFQAYEAYINEQNRMKAYAGAVLRRPCGEV